MGHIAHLNTFFVYPYKFLMMNHFFDEIFNGYFFEDLSDLGNYFVQNLEHKNYCSSFLIQS